MNEVSPEDLAGFEIAMKKVQAQSHGINCPTCRSAISISERNLRFHKHGRQTECPVCGKKIIMRRFVRRAP